MRATPERRSEAPPATLNLPLSKLFYELLMAADSMRSRWREQLDLSAYELLAVMHVLQEPMTVGELGRRLCLTSGAMTALVDRLCDRELIERASHPSDRRKVILRPTPRAQARVWALVGPVARSVDAIESSIDHDDAIGHVDLLVQVIRIYQDSAKRRKEP